MMSAMTKRPAIGIIGSLSEDVILFPHAKQHVKQVGGGIYYASLTLANLYAQVVAVPFLSKQDEAMLASFRHSSIELNPEWTTETTKYQTTYEDAAQTKQQRQLLKRAICAELSATTINRLLLSDGILITPLSPNELATSFYHELRKSTQGMIAIDVQGFTRGRKMDPPNVRECLANNVDIVKGDESELIMVAGRSNVKDAMVEICSWGAKEVLATAADQGAWLLTNGRLEKIQPFNIENIVDATGCGDAFLAAYLLSRVAGKTPKAAANYAAWVGAKNAEVSGPFGSQLNNN